MWEDKVEKKPQLSHAELMKPVWQSMEWQMLQPHHSHTQQRCMVFLLPCKKNDSQKDLYVGGLCYQLSGYWQDLSLFLVPSPFHPKRHILLHNPLSRVLSQSVHMNNLKNFLGLLLISGLSVIGIEPQLSCEVSKVHCLQFWDSFCGLHSLSP